MALIALTFFDWLITATMGVALGLCGTYAYKVGNQYRHPHAWRKRR